MIKVGPLKNKSLLWKLNYNVNDITCEKLQINSEVLMLRYAWTNKFGILRRSRTKFCRYQLQPGPVLPAHVHRSGRTRQKSVGIFRLRVDRRLSYSSGARSRVQIPSRFITRVVENVHARSVRRLPCKPPSVGQTGPCQVDRARGPHSRPTEIICSAQRGWY